MKTAIVKITILTGMILFLLFSTSISKEAEEMFPELNNWNLKVGDKVYSPDNLWDIINGAADLYLSYDFQRLYTAEYSDEQDRQIRAYIFEHSNPRNTFGIYSQERSKDYEFNETGATGFNSGNAYYFITGPYYVQISANDEGLNEPIELLAQLINKRLNQTNELPAELDLFPKHGKVPASEKYIAQNFLGYNFLHSAFIADYERAGKSFQVFIISPDDQQETKKMLNKYLDFVELPKDKRGKNKYILEDPYNESLLLWQNRKYLCGIIGADTNTKETYYEMLEARLK